MSSCHVNLAFELIFKMLWQIFTAALSNSFLIFEQCRTNLLHKFLLESHYSYRAIAKFSCHGLLLLMSFFIH